MRLMNGLCSLMIFVIISAALSALNPTAAQVDFRTCATGIITKECGHSLGQRVALNTGLPPTSDCCAALVKVGRACHDAFVQVHTASFTFLYFPLITN